LGGIAAQQLHAHSVLRVVDGILKLREKVEDLIDLCGIDETPLLGRILRRSSR
jgi:hypothetical protein